VVLQPRKLQEVYVVPDVILPQKQNHGIIAMKSTGSLSCSRGHTPTETVFLAPRIWLSCLYHLFFLLSDFGSPVYTICFSCSLILALLFIPFVFLAPGFWLSCLCHLFFLLPDFGSPVYTICFSCSQILALLFIPFGFLAPRFWLSCLYHLFFLLPDFGSPVYTFLSFNADLWDQENQMV
jgi:hypothetical protein